MGERNKIIFCWNGIEDDKQYKNKFNQRSNYL